MNYLSLSLSLRSTRSFYFWRYPSIIFVCQSITACNFLPQIEGYPSTHLQHTTEIVLYKCRHQSTIPKPVSIDLHTDLELFPIRKVSLNETIHCFVQESKYSQINMEYPMFRMEDIQHVKLENLNSKIFLRKAD